MILLRDRIQNFRDLLNSGSGDLSQDGSGKQLHVGFSHVTILWIVNNLKASITYVAGSLFILLSVCCTTLCLTFTYLHNKG
jgi:hypothetical protein